jgi:hypothetical protein
LGWFVQSSAMIGRVFTFLSQLTHVGSCGALGGLDPLALVDAWLAQGLGFAD